MGSPSPRSTSPLWNTTSLTVSEASTVLYEQESYESFAPKVESLLRDVFPDNTTSLTLHRLTGGAFNRVVAATLHDQSEVIVRIPRFESVTVDDVADDVALLSYLREKTDLPVPLVLSSDSTCNNAIENPYMIQEFIPGNILEVVYPLMTLEERMQVVKQVAHLLCLMNSVEFATIGRIGMDTQGTGVTIAPYPTEPFGKRVDPLCPAAVETLSAFIRTRADYWKQNELSVHQSMFKGGYMDSLLLLADRLLPLASPTSRNILHHPDLKPRNIIVDRDTKSGEYHVTALLDWDNAPSLPIEMAYELPSWLWNWRPDDSNPTSSDGSEPVEDEGRQLMEFFESEISKRIPDYLEIARSCADLSKVGWYMARGIWSATEFRAVERLLERNAIPKPDWNMAEMEEKAAENGDEKAVL